MMERGRDFLPRHQKAAIAHKANHCPFRMDNFCANRRRHRIAHGAIGGAKEILPWPHMHEARRPGREIAGIRRVDRIGRQSLFQILQGLRQIERPFVTGCFCLLHARGAQIPRPAGPGGFFDGRCGLGRRGKGIEVRSDTKCGAIDAPDFGLLRIDMHNRRRPCHVQQRITLAESLTEARPNGDDQIRILGMSHQARIGTDAKIAHIVLRCAVKNTLAAKANRHRQIIRQQEVADIGLALIRPA